MAWAENILAKVFGSKEKPKFLVDPKHPIELQWTDHTGEDYYAFQDPFQTPCLRGLHAITHFEELRMRTRREHLEKENDFTKEQIGIALKALSGDKGKVNLITAVDALREIEKVVTYRKERMALIWEPDIAYKLASVVFFDKSENPYLYDQAYGAKKIKRWKENEEIGAFFLRLPILRLMPYLEELGENLPNYSQMARKIISKQFDDLSTTKSRSKSTTAAAAK